MYISELKDDHETTMAWGVEIDEEVFDLPPNIRTVGLLWEGDAPDHISDRLIDTIIALNMTGVEVILEVRHDDLVDHEYLLTVGGHSGYSIAAIPPGSEMEVDAWADQCASFAKAILTVPNFSRHLFPVTGYLTYLVMEFFAGADAATPTDPYTVQRFVTPTPLASSDAVKARMRAAMSDILGGEDQLRDYLGAILKAIQDEGTRQILEIARQRTLQ